MQRDPRYVGHDLQVGGRAVGVLESTAECGREAAAAFARAAFTGRSMPVGFG